jgi:hypothetical protein
MDEASTFPAFESAAVVELKPGDVLLFRCPMTLSPEQRERAEAVLDEVFPAHDCMILHGGQDLAVLRPRPGLIRRLWQKVWRG